MKLNLSLGQMDVTLGEPEVNFERVRGWTAEDLRYWKFANENRLEWMRRFRDLGGTLVVGTDFQWGGITLHHELRNFAASGMDTIEIVAAATGRSARALGVGSKLGTIEEGLIADIVVLNRSPLDDLSALRDVEQVLKSANRYPQTAGERHPVTSRA